MPKYFAECRAFCQRRTHLALAGNLKLCTLFSTYANVTSQVQQFTDSMTVADFNGSEENSNSIVGREGTEIDAGTAKAAPAAAETTQGRLKVLANAVFRELRKGIDVGNIAATRAQAIRR